MPGSLAPRWTREQVLALPDDGNRYELFDGELLVTPALGGLHQLALNRLYDAVAPFVRQHRLGYLMWSPADLSLGGDQLSQPDLFVMPRLPHDRNDWSAYPDPILIVEVLSPSSARFDRTIKRRRFHLAGIPEYWIVDLDARAVERWTPRDERPEVLDESLRWVPPGAAVALELALPAFFAEVWGTGRADHWAPSFILRWTLRAGD
jgi:Uma2 family endonuclease